MSTTFSSFEIARTGAGFSRYWIDTISHNLANVNTINGPDEEPFKARYVVARALGPGFSEVGSGVAVHDIVEDPSDPAYRFDPLHPLANEEGVVTLPQVDIAGQMVDLMLANRTYQLNLQTIQTAKEAYQSALRLGSR